MVQSPYWEANWFAASQEIPRISRNPRFITALTSVCHLSLSWVSPIQSIYPHPTSWRSILILHTHLRLGLPSGLFASSFPTKTIYLLSYLLTYLLTPWCKVLHEKLTGLQVVRISRNLKVHYRNHKRPPTVSILGQSNTVHIPTSHLLEIHPNIIHPSTPRSPQWSPSLRFPHQDPIRGLFKKYRTLIFPA